jgi:pre-60S factor REI1
VAQGGPEDWPEWDPCVSLFDNKVSSSMEENLQYMYKTFGFFLPDAEYLADPEGLLKYLGAKLSYGKVRRMCRTA